MLDSNTPINENRIAGILQELFVDRVVEMKDMLKNNLKTMKVKDQFDLRGDGWLQGIIQKWEQTFMPDLMDEVMDIKRTPDIKDRAPKMRAFLHSAGTGTSPMNVLSVMEDDYRRGAEALHEPEPEQPVDPETIPENEPGFLRRTMRGAGSYAGGLARVAGSAAGAGLLMQRGMIGSLARGVASVYGLHKAARKFTQTKAATATSGRKSSVRSLFGAGKSAFRVKQNTDFTPREEQLEADGATSILKRIEEKTAALLEKFTGKGQGEKKGMFGGIMDMFGGIGKSLLSLLTGAAMKAAIVALGVALAAAFGKEAADYLCKKFSWLCPNADRTNSEWQKDIIGGVDSFAKEFNDATGKTLSTQRRAAQNRVGQIELDQREKEVMGHLQSLTFGSGLNAKKFTPEQVAGVMGSMKGENTTFDPSAINPSSGAFGLMQLVGDRKQLFYDWADRKGYKRDDPKAQIEFMAYEYSVHPDVKPKGYKGDGSFNEKRNYDKIFEATDPSDVSRIYGHDVMRFDTKNKAGQYHDSKMTDEIAAEHYMKRAQWAEEFYPAVLENAGVIEAKPNKAFTPKNSVSIEETLKNMEHQIAHEPDWDKREQIDKAYNDLKSKYPNYVPGVGMVTPKSRGENINPVKPKAAAPKAGKITSPAEKHNESAGGTTLNVVAPKSEQSSIPKQRPGHRIQDESADKRNMEIRQFGLPR